MTSDADLAPTVFLDGQPVPAALVGLRVDRSPPDFTTIAAACRALGVTARAIRFYEARGLIRCLRAAGSRRVLDRETYERLRRIVDWRGLGLSLLEIKTILDAAARGPERLQADLAAILRRLDDQRGRILAYVEAMERA